jgi:hypothetical protein
MSQMDSVVSELADLNDALRGYEGHVYEQYTGSWLMQQSLERRRERLYEELNASLEAQTSPALALLFEGGPAEPDSIRASFLGRVLTHLQDSVLSLVQAEKEGMRLRGAFSEEVLRAGTLRVAGLARGSFGVVLIGPVTPIQGTLIEPQPSTTSPIDQSLRNVLDLFSLAATPEADDRLISSALDTPARAIGHIHDMVSACASSGARLKMRWHVPGEEDQSAELGQVDARHLADVLADIETTSHEEQVEGVLVELSMIRDRFTLQFADAPLLRGTVDPTIRDDVARYMNSYCRATVVTTISRSRATGRLREAGHLVDISPAVSDQS